MAHPLIWPGNYSFYPIGRTSATCLTRHLFPDEPAHVLLLECGDPCHILYTVYSEPQNPSTSKTRKLDFTCCDKDPALLARNVLLFTMLLDGLPITSTIWNMFFHVFLDKDSHAALVEQCTKLISLSESSQHWNASPYGSVLRMCTDFTLEELARHWAYYVNMENYPQYHLISIRQTFTDLAKFVSDMKASSMASRSAGPTFDLARPVIKQQYQHYWEKGVTFTDSANIAASTLLNPTFFYCLSGEGCSVNPGTDSMMPFHHAALFGNALVTPTVADLVKSSKTSFNNWCKSFKNLSRNCVVRFMVGEATAICATLAAYGDMKSTDIGIPAMPWRMTPVILNKEEYSGSAPHVFNVIHTSDLEDEISSLNLVTATVPLLSRSTPSSTLYTESFRFNNPPEEEDATKYYRERLHADFTLASLLFGICPVDYVSNFSTYSDASEILWYENNKGKVAQFYRAMTWKFVTSGDVLAAQDIGLSTTSSIMPAPLVFDTNQLARLLFNMYRDVYGLEDLIIKMDGSELAKTKSFQLAGIMNYSRETFVLVLKLIKKNLQISSEEWRKVMDCFTDLGPDNVATPLNRLHYYEFCAHMYRHSIYKVPIYDETLQRPGFFKTWSSIPRIIRVFLSVPRSAFTVIENMPSDLVAAPPLRCSIRGQFVNYKMTSLRAFFGRVISIGTDSYPCVRLEEDTNGWKGKSTGSLVVSFVTSTSLLTDTEPHENLNIRLGFTSTPGTFFLEERLGMELVIYSAKLTDKKHVFVIPEDPLPQPATATSTKSNDTNLLAEIGVSKSINVELDKQCRLISTFTRKVAIENDQVRQAFENGETPQVTQVSPCVMRLAMSGYEQDIVYPFPVIGSQNKLKLARKSQWVEVSVPVSGPFKPEGIKLTPFPVISRKNQYTSWNIHRVNLSRLPTLDSTGMSKQMDELLKIQLGATVSLRERAQWTNPHKDEKLWYIKHSLHDIFIHATGLQEPSEEADALPPQPVHLVTLLDETSMKCDTVFFICDVKYDLPSHTMVCDGYVVTLTEEIKEMLPSAVHQLFVGEGVHDRILDLEICADEMQIWKQLIPAFVERCRTWTHALNCEYVSRGKIPLSEKWNFNPICSCGRGKNTERMKNVALWREFAPYATRVALSPLFLVSYLEPLLLPERCAVCRKEGKLMTCGGCKNVRYCGPECQKKGWRAHKPLCKRT